MVDKGSGSAFDDLVQEEETDEESNEATEPEPVSTETDSTETTVPSRTRDRQAQPAQSTPTPPQEGPSLEDSSPPFPFADAEQDSMYPRKGTWDEISDFEYNVEGLLRSEYGVRNAETREVHEAMLQVFLDRIPPELVARRIVEQRGFSPD